MSNFLLKLLQLIGIIQTPENKAMSELVKSGYKSSVVGRGTVMVDVEDVMADPNFINFRAKAKRLTNRYT